MMGEISRKITGSFWEGAVCNPTRSPIRPIALHLVSFLVSKDPTQASQRSGNLDCKPCVPEIKTTSLSVGSRSGVSHLSSRKRMAPGSATAARPSRNAATCRISKASSRQSASASARAATEDGGWACFNCVLHAVPRRHLTGSCLLRYCSRRSVGACPRRQKAQTLIRRPQGATLPLV